MLKPVKNAQETAQFILRVLREDIGQFPDFATPKKALPAIMQTEKMIQALEVNISESGRSNVCLAMDYEELEDLLDKARVLRARFLVRSILRGEGDLCDFAARLDGLVEAKPNILKRVRYPAGKLAAVLSGLVCEVA